MKRKHQGRIFLIEGSVSVGKSSLVRSLSYFAKDLSTPDDNPIIVFMESVGPHLLKWFLAERERNAFAFQLIMVRDRLAAIRRAIELAENENAWVFMDRGIPGDMAFALNNSSGDKPNIAPDEMRTYCSDLRFKAPNFLPDEIFSLLCPGEFAPPFDSRKVSPFQDSSDAFKDIAKSIVPITIVYLQTSPGVAFRRMLEREVPEEVDSYTEQFFVNLHKIYDAVIDCFEENWKRANVVRINYNDDFVIKKKSSGTHAGSVLNFPQTQRLFDEMSRGEN